MRIRIRDIALSWVSYGYRRIQVLLKREGWRQEYNSTRPRRALGNLAPEEFAEAVGTVV
ncbi:hypothetical protein ACFLTY_03145 [Chloroflexota bacterium]